VAGGEAKTRDRCSVGDKGPPAGVPAHMLDFSRGSKKNLSTLRSILFRGKEPGMFLKTKGGRGKLKGEAEMYMKTKEISAESRNVAENK
jgi:hypothetical protein